MSLSETAAKARAANMTYGQYCAAVERGEIIEDEHATSCDELREQAEHSNGGKVKWTDTLINQVRAMYSQGLSASRIASSIGVGTKAVYYILRKIKKLDSARAEISSICEGKQ